MKCLLALGELTSPEGFCHGFNILSEETGIERRKVRLSVRRLARKGFAEYHKGLWNEHSGEPAGAGYCITFEGQDVLKEPKQ